MLEIFNLEFMQRALAAGALIGLVCSICGVFVVYRGLAFIGAGISHAAFAGVAIALLFAWPILLTTLIFCSLVALITGFAAQRGNLENDTAVGISYAAFMALGLVLVGFLENKSIDLQSYLFGSLLAVSAQDLRSILVLSLIVLFCIFLLYKEFVLTTFDQELAFITGIPFKTLSYLLLVLLAITIVIASKAVGIILVSALLVTPAATAMQLAEDFDRVLLYSSIIGVTTTVGGLVVSYYLNSAPGASIVLFSTLIFIFSLTISKLCK